MISEKDVDDIAALARIDLSDVMRERMKNDLSSILDYIEVLQSVPVDGVQPLYQVSGQTNMTRADEHRDDFPMTAELNQGLVGQAPQAQDGYVKVLSVLKKK